MSDPVIEISGARIERHADHILTTFPDGASTANWPPDDPDGSFRHVAESCGISDLLAYLHEHEVAHLLVPLRLFGETGYVSWMAAHGRKMSLAAARAEERLIYWVQRMTDDPALDHPDPQMRAVADELRAYGLRANQRGRHLRLAG